MAEQNDALHHSVSLVQKTPLLLYSGSESNQLLMMETHPIRIAPVLLALAALSASSSVAAPGNLDTSFNPNAGDHVDGIALQPNGQILIGGAFHDVSGVTRNHVARLDASGSLDATFNPDANGGLSNVGFLRDGRVVVAGGFGTMGGQSRPRLAVLFDDGTVDLSFDPSLNPGLNLGSAGSIGGMAIQWDEKIVAYPSNTRLRRFNSNGLLDPTYVGDVNGVNTIAIQPTRKIVVAGKTIGFWAVGDGTRIARLNEDGSFDSSFPRATTFISVYADSHFYYVDADVYASAVQADSKILIGGLFTFVNSVSRNHLARLNHDGTLDTTFNPNVNNTVTSIVLQADGKIIITGYFTSVGGVARNRIARLNANGSVDTSFVDPNANSAVYSAAIQEDGRILAGGTFVSMGGQARNYLARLMNDTATQSFVLPTLNRFQWFRGGSSPEAQDVTFDLSTDGGNTWQPLGNAVRITGGWQMDGLNLTTSGLFRCRARATGGIFNGSSGLIEQLASFKIEPEIAVEQPTGTNIADGGSKSFGSVFVGANTSLPFTIKNTGNANLTDLTITKGGANSDDFTITADPTAPVAIGGSTTFTVQFAPTSTGARSATLHIASNDADENPFDITLTGTGIEAARLTNPAPGSTLTSATTTFTWSAGFGVSEYYLNIGSAVGGTDIYNANQGTTLSRTVTVPSDGRTLHVKLWSKIDGVWWYYTYALTAWMAPPPVKAAMISPAPGAALTSGTVTFTWDAGVSVSQYSLWIGSNPGTYDVHNAGLLTTLARTVTLPVDGRTLHVSLWTLINGTWQSNAYTYTAWAAPAPVKAAMIAPVPGAALTSGTVTFTWDPGVNVSQYSLWIGSNPGTYDVHNAGLLTTLSRTVTLPSDGRTLHVSLWTFINGSWQSNAYTYIAWTAPPPVKAKMLGPVPNGGAFDSSSVTFTWDAGVSVNQYSLWVGNSPGTYDLHNAGLLTSTLTRSVTLPTDGRTVYVSLWTFMNGAWKANNYYYGTTTVNPSSGKATMAGPSPDSTLGGSSVTFTWNPAVGSTRYSLWVGNSPILTSPDAYSLYNAGLITNQTTATATLPTDGRTLNVALWTDLNGSWQANLYTYTAFTAAGGTAKAKMLTPADGTLLPGATVTFTWDAGLGASQYSLWVGGGINNATSTNPEAYNIHNAGLLTNTYSRTVTLPTDGSPVYVTLWTFLNGKWQSNMYDYQAFIAP